MIDVTVITKDNGNITVSEWDDGGVWIYIALRSATSSIVLSKFEAEKFFSALEDVLRRTA